ncbi:hypothetical protein F511_47686 [Dorcoceras hygrometricum]|uniref:Uncharacterized protein n=1 Tax=Dorcoceras hygrometricum TaxID=472368 RepID=A0A2Z6ZR00_9LAMI|nr:hypothetical protein F511_47686 [Dorcoceras hygrometricum]
MEARASYSTPEGMPDSRQLTQQIMIAVQKPGTRQGFPGTQDSSIRSRRTVKLPFVRNSLPSPVGDSLR